MPSTSTHLLLRHLRLIPDDPVATVQSRAQAAARRLLSGNSEVEDQVAIAEALAREPLTPEDATTALAFCLLRLPSRRAVLANRSAPPQNKARSTRVALAVTDRVGSLCDVLLGYGANLSSQVPPGMVSDHTTMTLLTVGVEAGHTFLLDRLTLFRPDITRSHAVSCATWGDVPRAVRQHSIHHAEGQRTLARDVWQHIPTFALAELAQSDMPDPDVGLLGPVCEAWTGRKPISRNGCHGYLSQL
jgi:hypothetical protein